jgi:excisionase family DNA binding protein
MRPFDKTIKGPIRFICSEQSRVGFRRSRRFAGRLRAAKQAHPKVDLHSENPCGVRMARKSVRVKSVIPQSPSMAPRGLRIPEAACYIGETNWFVEVRVRSGEIPARMLGDHWVIEKADLDAWADKQEPTNGTPSGKVASARRSSSHLVPGFIRVRRSPAHHQSP